MAALRAILKAALPLVLLLLTQAASSHAAETTQVVLLSKAGKAPLAAKPACIGNSSITIRADKEATVEVRESEHTTAVRVLAGTVVVRNLIDHSIVRLATGTAYECTTGANREPSAFNEKANDALVLFETKSNTSYLYTIGQTTKVDAQIISPPNNQSYAMGSIASTRLPMPRMTATHFPPSGVVVWQPATPVLAGQANPQ